MEYGIGELAKRMDVSIRTLRYYDEIGLLRPGRTSQSGYRFYDEAGMAKLQQILFFRELEFPLTQIAEILSRPDYDAVQALMKRRELLKEKRRHIDQLIHIVDRTLKEDQDMKEEKTKLESYSQIKERYREEAAARWGSTPEYAQSQEKEESRTPRENAAAMEDAEEIFAAFARHMDGDPGDEGAQALVKRWQEHITRYHYDCSKEILSCLGEMYAADQRFTENIDRHGDGLAVFIRDAIRAYCAR